MARRVTFAVAVTAAIDDGFNDHNNDDDNNTDDDDLLRRSNGRWGDSIIFLSSKKMKNEDTRKEK